MQEPAKLTAAKTVENKQPKKNKISVRKLKYGTLATVMTAVFVAVAILINVVIGLAAKKIDLTVDYTEEQVYTLCEETLAFLQEMPSSAEIIILGDETDLRSQVSNGNSISPYQFIVQTSDNYARASEKITVHYVDPTYNPAFFSSRGITIDTSSGSSVFMVIYCPETQRNRQIYSNIFDDLQYVGLERRMTGGLLYTTKADIQTIAVVTGHGEQLPSQFQTLMKDNGFDVKTINLADHEYVPDIVDILLIINPSRTYNTADIEKIDTFLSNGELLGKHLMVFSDLDAGTNPLLYEYLREWGIEFGTEAIFDTQHSYHISNAYEPFLRLTYEKDALFSTLLEGEYYLDVHLGKARAISALFESEDGIETYTLVKTFDSAFSRFIANTNISASEYGNIKKKDTDTDGPFSVMLLSAKARFEGTDRISSNVIACGSTSFMDDYYLSNVDGSKQTTSESMVELVKYLVSATEDIDTSILPKSLIADYLNFTTTYEVVLVFLGLTFGVPAIFAVIGIIVYRRRKFL